MGTQHVMIRAYIWLHSRLIQYIFGVLERRGEAFYDGCHHFHGCEATQSPVQSVRGPSALAYERHTRADQSPPAWKIGEMFPKPFLYAIMARRSGTAEVSAFNLWQYK
jgi:hypothetical protein